MAKRKEKEIPHIIIEESPANDLYLLLDGLMTGGAHLARQAFEAIRDEGREFTQKTESKEFKSLIGVDLFQDNEKIADFLSRIESIFRREPRLLAAAEVVAKYLREMKAFPLGPGHGEASENPGREEKAISRERLLLLPYRVVFIGEGRSHPFRDVGDFSRGHKS